MMTRVMSSALLASAIAVGLVLPGGGAATAVPTTGPALRSAVPISGGVMPTSVGIIDNTCTGTVLRTGSSGRCVHILQLSINSLFHTYLVTDGVFGVATAGWVRGIQAKYGLGVDGIVGAKTWATLQYCEMRALNGLPY